MARQNTPRPAWRRRLIDIKSTLTNEIYRWRSDSKVWQDPADRKPGENPYARPRRPDEYPENSPTELEAGATLLYGLAIELNKLAMAMTQRAQLLRAANR